MERRPRVFLDTSVLFAAVLSPEGGARMVLKLGEAGLLTLLVGNTVLAEADSVVAREAPETRPRLALLLDAAAVAVGPRPSRKVLRDARVWVAHAGDAAILAEALAARAEWLLSHDKRHLLGVDASGMGLKIGTPGDLIASLRESLIVRAVSLHRY
jgi:predicted nucleic acid-binding protein